MGAPPRRAKGGFRAGRALDSRSRPRSPTAGAGRAPHLSWPTFARPRAPGAGSGDLRAVGAKHPLSASHGVTPPVLSARRNAKLLKKRGCLCGTSRKDGVFFEGMPGLKFRGQTGLRQKGLIVACARGCPSVTFH